MSVAITGNTYPVKDAIKALGGRWDADSKCWMVPDAKAEEARKLVAGAPKSERKSMGSSSYPSYRGRFGRRQYQESDDCNCRMCRSGSECLCLRGRG